MRVSEVMATCKGDVPESSRFLVRVRPSVYLNSMLLFADGGPAAVPSHEIATNMSAWYNTRRDIAAAGSGRDAK